MPWQKTPGVAGDPYENLTPEELDGLPARVQDAYINEAKHTEKRPGLSLLKDTGTAMAIDGLYWWDEKAMVIIVSNAKVYTMTDSSGTLTNLTGTGIPAMNTRPTFTTDGTRVFIANGGRILYTDGTALTVYIADVHAPTAVTFITYIDGYIVANLVGSQTFYWSNTNDYATWNPLNFATAEGQPDPISMITSGWGEVMIGGTRSTERWIDDGVTPFARLQGGLLQSGVIAPYSFAKVGQTWMWLDEKRRLVEMQKYDAVSISNPFEKTIQDLIRVDDAIADCMEIRGYPLYVLTFPTADFTLVFNYRTKSWSRWGYWDGNSATYKRFRGNAYCYAKTWNLHLVGDQNNGQIYTASRSVYQDAGNPIRTFRRTGYNSFGQDTLKTCHELRIRTHCGDGLNDGSGTAPVMSVRWRDDGRTSFGNDHQVSLGAVGNTYMYVHLRRLGHYRARQWEFIHSDNSDFVLVDAEENCEVVTGGGA